MPNESEYITVSPDAVFSEKEFNEAYEKCLASDLHVCNERNIPDDQSIFSWLLNDPKSSGDTCEKLRAVLEK